MTLKRSFEHDRDSSVAFESRTSIPLSKRRRRCFPMTVVSSQTTTTNETTESTVFPEVQPVLTAGEQEEISIFFIQVKIFCLDALLTRIKEEVRRLQRRHQLKILTSSDVYDDSNANEYRSSTHHQHLLTLKQVNMICARLLKEREEKVREEYDRILSNKINGKI